MCVCVFVCVCVNRDIHTYIYIYIYIYIYTLETHKTASEPKVHNEMEPFISEAAKYFNKYFIK